MNVLKWVFTGKLPEPKTLETKALVASGPSVPSAASDFGRDFYAHVADLEKKVVMYQNKLAEKSVVLGPQTRRHIEHLERQYKMEQLRTKDLREQLLELSAQLTVLQEAGNSDLVEDYEGLSPDEVIPWVERVLLPAYGLAVAKLKAFMEPAQLANADPVFDYAELEAAGVKPKCQTDWVFADEESEERFHQLRRCEIVHGLIVIEGPPRSGKTVMGTVLAGRDSARQWPTEQVMERTIRSDIGDVLFYDDIDTREPWYRGDVPQPGGETLHSHAIVEALTKKWPLMVILAGQHVELSPEMQRLGTVNIRLKGGAE